LASSPRMRQYSSRIGGSNCGTKDELEGETNVLNAHCRPLSVAFWCCGLSQSQVSTYRDEC
jgi:hypothetical protein